MHLERVLIVVESPDKPDGSYAAFDIHHMLGPLQSSGLVDNIDVLYYSEYTPNCDEAVINYCLQKKPQAVLLSLQSMVVRGGGLTPDAARKITHQLHIPTALLWFSIYVDSTAALLESFFSSVTLNMILGADPSSHKPMHLEGTNHVYAMVNFDDRLFKRLPDNDRDIPVGLLGSLVPFRRQWLDGLDKHGVTVYTGGGQLVDGGDTSFSTGKAPPLWMPYEKYLNLTSRFKIVLNFSSGMGPMLTPAVSPTGQAERLLVRLLTQMRLGLSALVKNPAKIKDVLPALKRSTSVSVNKPRAMTRTRVMEALWCRTFLLEEENPITSVYFEPYVDYVPFTTLKDLVDKIRYYLKHDDERERIRLQGRATVEKYFNARIYCENIFEVMGIPSDTQFQHHPGEIWNKAHFDNWFLYAGTKK
jgi:hypothetical protein